MSTPNTTPAAKPTLYSIQIGTGRITTAVVANTRTKNPALKGTQAWKPVLSGDEKKSASLAQIVTALGVLGITDQLAPHIERDLFIPLMRESSELCLDTKEDGTKVLNPAKLPEAVLKVLASWSTSKSEVNEKLREELAAANQRQAELFQEFNKQIATAQSFASAEEFAKFQTTVLQPLTNQVSQLTIKIAEITAKLAPKAKKS